MSDKAKEIHNIFLQILGEPNDSKEDPESVGTFQDYHRFIGSLLFKYCLTNEFTVNDVFNEMYRKCIDGERNWDRTKDITFKKFLIGAINSYLSDVLTKRVRHREIERDNASLIFGKGYTEIGEYSEIYQSCIEEFAKIFNGKEIIECLYMKNMTNQHTATHLGIEIKEVVNMKRRVDRKLVRLATEFLDKDQLKTRKN
jgi:hypothetical protein